MSAPQNIDNGPSSFFAHDLCSMHDRLRSLTVISLPKHPQEILHMDSCNIAYDSFCLPTIPKSTPAFRQANRLLTAFINFQQGQTLLKST